MNPGVDVVVVGAGLAGCSLAWHLAPHARVLLLEQGPRPGAEASDQSAGMVRRLGEDPHERALALRTTERLAELDLGHPDFDGPPSRAVGAVLGLAHDPAHLSDAVAHLRSHGARVEACDRPAEVAPALRASPLRRAWYLPDERVADAQALVAGFLRGARRHGAELRCGVEVEGPIVAGGRCVGVRTRAGDVHADHTVLAAGAWSARLAADAVPARPLVPIRRAVVRTAAHPLSHADHPWCWVDDVGVYARPDRGRWLMSGCDETPDRPPTGPGSRGEVAPELLALTVGKVARYLPALADVVLDGGWTGLRTFAPDRRPVLGADPALEGLWWVAGLGGFGVSGSLAVGEAVAAWMRGGAVSWLAPNAVSPGRAFLRRWAIRPHGTVEGARLIGHG